jgi:hypothetical protein
MAANPWDNDPIVSAAPAAAGPGAITSLVNDTGRAAVLAYRGIVTGAAGIPQAALDAADSVNALNPHSALSRAFTAGILRQPDPGPNAPAPDASAPYTPQLSDFVHPDKWQKAAEYFADKAGLPKPETDADKVLYKGAQAVPYAVTAPEALIPGAVSAAAGGAASEATRQAGGGPLAQTLAGLAAGSAPALGTAAAGLTRTVARGAGADAAATMKANIDNAAANNIPLTVGQAGGSKLAQAVEAASGNLWGGGAIDKTAATQTSGLQSRVSDIVDSLSGGETPSPTAAGNAINAGAATAKTNMRVAEKAAYDNVDSLVPPQSPVDVSGTFKTLNTLATPTPGAEATTGALISPKIAAMRDNLQADIAQNGGTTVPYSAAADLRTQLGTAIDWGFSPADPVTNGALKLVHGALKGDIDAGASAISPEAQQAVTDARTLYAQNQARRTSLNAVIDKTGGPEAVYAAATNGTKEGATKIGGVMSALDPGQQNLVRATVIDRLGRAVPSAQNAAGSAFDAGTFLTNWGKLDPAAKDALFGASGAPKSLRASLDSLTDTIQTLKNSRALVNPSGTAKAGGHSLGLWGLLTEAGGAITTGAVTGNLEAGIATAAGSVGAAAGAAGVNALLARALTNPRTARWLATTTKLPASALPNAISQLSKMGKVDPDARDLSAALQGNKEVTQ